MPVASVVVPHLNTPDLLVRCLESVTTQDLRGDFEVLVVDNGSKLPLDIVQDRFRDVQFLSEPEPGPGLARNRGAASATAPILAFIDADCRAAPGWLQAAVDAVAPDVRRNVVGGDIRIDTVDPRQMTGMEAYESVFGFRQRWYIETRRFSVTANLAMGKDVFAAVGPFKGIDTAEDMDWGRRAHAAGYPTRFVEAMRVYHPARPDFPSMASKWARLIDHEARAHRASGAPAWKWRARAAALVLAVPVEGIKMFTSPRLAGPGNRLRGLGALARIRAYRAAEMLRALDGRSSGAKAWNR